MSIPSTSQQDELEVVRQWQLWRPHDAKLFSQQVEREFVEDDQRMEILQRNLLKLYNYAAEHVPYYQDLLASTNIRIDRQAVSEQWNRIPVLNRFNVVESFDQLTARRARGRALPTTKTTGSTALPVKVLHTPRSMAMFAYLWQRHPRWFGLDVNKRFARIRLPKELFRMSNGQLNPDGHTGRGKSWLHSGQFFKTGDEIHFNLANTRMSQLNWIAENRPAYLLTFPGLLEELALANECKPLPGVEAVLAIASMLTSSMRRRIEESFGVPVHQNYGLNEVGLVALRCEAGRYHVHDEHVHVEIVDAEGIPVSDGESGRLLVTTLNNAAMPLLRYDTGDIARAASSLCPCGRKLPSFADIVGRYIRFAGTPDGTRERLNGLLSALSDFPNDYFRHIRKYQIYQSADCRFEFRVEAQGELHEDFRSRIEAAWSQLNNGPDKWPLSIERVDEIESTPSGKQLDFVSAFHAAEKDFN